MKIDRLIGILSVLLQRDMVSAPYLAEKFEVSRRTIHRDVEDLCKAGIPIATRQGANGGISIMENYKIDRTLLTNSDMQDILTGLRSLDSVSGTNRYQCLMEKFSKNEYEKTADSQIVVDLSGWDKSFVSDKLELLKLAIEKHLKVTFYYSSPIGESERKAEPYQIIFQWSNWYLWAYCVIRQDYRMFKITRITELKCTDETFAKRENAGYIRQDHWDASGDVKAVIKFDKSARWKVIDDFGAERLSYDNNGDIWLSYVWVSKELFFYHMLSFGDKAEIVEPVEFRNEFCDFVKKILIKYNKT